MTMAGTRGLFAIDWTQTEIDEDAAPPRAALRAGMPWRWHGQPVRLDGPREVLLLAGDPGVEALRSRAARTARRLTRTTPPALEDDSFDPDAPEPYGFLLTDGHREFPVALVETGADRPPLLVVVDVLPPQGAPLWVVRLTGTPPGPRQPAVICFAAGTLIDTPRGPRLVETLGPGDRVSTRDDGPQPVVWAGSRRISGARLHAQPGLRPVRLRAGALGEDRPVRDLLVSPSHRLLIEGPTARLLYGCPEVLVRAADLIDDRSVAVMRRMREVTYVHLMLERHQILWANGVAAESFHPADMPAEEIAPAPRAALDAVLPGGLAAPALYGEMARRCLSRAEAALLSHGMGRGH